MLNIFALKNKALDMMTNQNIEHCSSSSSLRIAVVAHALRAAGGLSVGLNMVAALQRVAPEHTYFFLLPAHVGYEELCLKKNDNKTYFYQNKGGSTGRFLFDSLKAPKLIKNFKPDIILCLANKGTNIHLCPQVILCHDPHLFYPSKHFSNEILKKKIIKAYLKWQLGRDLRHTQLLLCQTPVTEKRLLDTFDYRGKTAICPNAVSRMTLNGSDDINTPDKLLPYLKKFKLLCLTRYYPHKNIEAIIRTYDHFREELKDVVVVLTISEDQHPKAGKLLRSIELHGLSHNIINVGPLPQESLVNYFQTCQAMILPTLLESFSGTYLEAMQFNLPILTSDLDFAHEVCGDAALYFNPWEPESIKNIITKLITDQKLQQTLATKGQYRANKFHRTWDEIVSSIVTHLENCAKFAPID